MDVTWTLGEDAALGLANTIHGPGGHYRQRARVGDRDHDHLADPESARAFLADHRVPVPTAEPSAAQLARLRAIRDAIRALADAATDLDDWKARIDRLLDGAVYRFSATGRLGSAVAGWDGLLDDLLPPALQLAADRGRLRTCGNPRCRWLFVDRSRNRSRRWCEMAVCGNRMKVGRHRLGAAARPDQPPR